MSSQIMVYTVLRSGGDFHERHVYRLRSQVAKHLTVPHQFVCLTDLVETDLQDAAPLQKLWPGWWSKVELFAQVVDRAIYFDLDTTIQGNIDWMLECHGVQADLETAATQELTTFWMLEDFNFEGVAQSGVMAWRGDHSWIYRDFLQCADSWIRQDDKSALRGGDSAYIRTKVMPQLLQREFPGRICSYKCSTDEEKAEASVICFHGRPRPWEV